MGAPEIQALPHRMKGETHMAEILVKAVNHWLTDTPDEQLTPEQLTNKYAVEKQNIGAVAIVRPDGWSWGRKEGPPKFILVKIPSVDVAEVQQYMAMEVDEAHTDPATTRKRKERRYSFPAQFVQNALAQGGVTTITKKQVDNYMKHQ